MTPRGRAGRARGVLQDGHVVVRRLRLGRSLQPEARRRAARPGSSPRWCSAARRRCRCWRRARVVSATSGSASGTTDWRRSSGVRSGVAGGRHRDPAGVEAAERAAMNSSPGGNSSKARSPGGPAAATGHRRPAMASSSLLRRASSSSTPLALAALVLPSQLKAVALGCSAARERRTWPKPSLRGPVDAPQAARVDAERRGQAAHELAVRLTRDVPSDSARAPGSGRTRPPVRAVPAGVHVRHRFQHLDADLADQAHVEQPVVWHRRRARRAFRRRRTAHWPPPPAALVRRPSWPSI